MNSSPFLCESWTKSENCREPQRAWPSSTVLLLIIIKNTRKILRAISHSLWFFFVRKWHNWKKYHLWRHVTRAWLLKMYLKRQLAGLRPGWEVGEFLCTSGRGFGSPLCDGRQSWTQSWPWRSFLFSTVSLYVDELQFFILRHSTVFKLENLSSVESDLTEIIQASLAAFAGWHLLIPLARGRGTGPHLETEGKATGGLTAAEEPVVWVSTCTWVEFSMLGPLMVGCLSGLKVFAMCRAPDIVLDTEKSGIRVNFLGKKYFFWGWGG